MLPRSTSHVSGSFTVAFVFDQGLESREFVSVFEMEEVWCFNMFLVYLQVDFCVFVKNSAGTRMCRYLQKKKKHSILVQYFGGLPYLLD